MPNDQPPKRTIGSLMQDMARGHLSMTRAAIQRKGILCLSCGCTYRGGLSCPWCGHNPLRVVRGGKKP